MNNTFWFSVKISFHILLTINLLYSVTSGYKLTILHTNDVHSEFEQFNEFGLPCTQDDLINSQCFGGIARRFSAVREAREKNENVLFVDAGDAFQGTAWFDLYQGNATAHFMNYLGYDAMAVGNHELDNGVAGFVPFLKNVNFSVLSCNMDTTDEPSLTYLIKKSVVLEIGGEQIGVIGYTTSLAPMLTNTGKLQFEDEVEALQREVNRLTAAGVNKIIAVGHSGYGVDLDIAAKVTGVDVIVGGHSSSFLYTGTPPTNDIPVGLYPTIVQSDIDPAHTTLVVTAYMHGKYLGFLQVEFDEEGTIRHFNGNPILLDSKIKEDKDALIEISKWRKGVDNYLPNIVGESFVLLKGVFNYCEDKECGLGNLVADAMVWKSMVNQGSRGWSDVGVAMINGGAIRSSLNTGKLLERDVLALVPFKSTIRKVELTGLRLLQVIEASIVRYGTLFQSGSFFQVSGLLLDMNVSQPVGNRVTSMYVRCTECLEPEYEPLDLFKTYFVLVPSFISDGGDGMSIFIEDTLSTIDTGILLMDAIKDFIQTHSPIIYGKERRIVL